MPSAPVWAGATVRRSNSTITVSNPTPSASTSASAASLRPSIRISTDAAAALTKMQDDARNLSSSVQTQLKVSRDSTPQHHPLLWEGANEVLDSTGSLKITQTKQQAYLQWDKFDIGKNDTLEFDQSAGGSNVNEWIAFNFIRDISGNPSNIYGKITAGGQVYILNANGILFGGSAQVNTHTLVASSLPLNTSLLKRGLLNNPDNQFLFTVLKQDAGTQGPTDSFDPANPTDISSSNTSIVIPKQTPLAWDDTAQKAVDSIAYGSIKVAPGASLTSPSNADNVGGRIALIGPTVINQGTIYTPNGQTIMAAGLQVALSAHNTSDASLRGLDVYVGAVAATNAATAEFPGDIGVVRNEGVVINEQGIKLPPGYVKAPHGSVIMTGKTVEEYGIIECSTSVSLNGRIDLLADYDATSTVYNPAEPETKFVPFHFLSSGEVILGKESGGDIIATARGGARLNGVLQILPDWASSETVIGASLALPSLINIQGKTITLNDSSAITAPGAALPGSGALDALGKNLTAGVTINAGVWKPASAISYIQGRVFVHAGGQSTDSTQPNYIDPSEVSGIALAPNAIIDVAGSQVSDLEKFGGIQPTVADNIISVELRGTELADFPLQRNGALRGATVKVDARLGTTVADVSGYVGLLKSTVYELTKDGGTISLNAGGSVSLSKGSLIDVSGGAVNFAGAMVETSRLVSKGHVYDITNASPNIVYDGVYGAKTKSVDTKWGVTAIYVPGLQAGGAHFEAGYTNPGNGGGLSIAAPKIDLGGTLLGNTVESDLRTVATTPSLLKLTFLARDLSILTDQLQYPLFSVAAPTIIFQSTSPDSTLTYDPETKTDVLSFSTDLVEKNGFGKLIIDDRDGRIEFGKLVLDRDGKNKLSDGTHLNLGNTPNSANSIELEGSIIDIEGTIVANGGSVTLNALNVPTAKLNSIGVEAPVDQITPLPFKDPNDATSYLGRITLGENASIDCSGLFIDERGGAQKSGGSPLVTKGGSIALKGLSITLNEGSILNVSGGGDISAAGKIIYGDAGSIAIASGRDLSDGIDANVLGGGLVLGAQLYGYSGTANAGALSIQVQQLQIGGDPSKLGAVAVRDADVWHRAADQKQGLPDLLILSPDFFNQGGFSNFTLTALGYTANALNSSGLPSLDITSGSKIVPGIKSWKLSPDGVMVEPSLDPNLTGSLATPFVLTLNAPTLKVNERGAETAYLGAVRMDPGLKGDSSPTLIELPANTLSAVAITASEVSINGTIKAPGGMIIINDDPGQRDLGQIAHITIDIGPEGHLSTAGQTRLTKNVVGHRTGPVLSTGTKLRTGTVLNGGQVSITGNIIAEFGSTIDVGGHSDVLDVPATYVDPDVGASQRGGVYTSTQIDSNGGAIVLKGGESLYINAVLSGAAGGMARGGSLVVSSGSYNTTTGVVTPTDSNLIVTQQAEIYGLRNGAYLGQSVSGAGGKDLEPKGYFGADSFLSGGFDSLTLGGSVKFVGGSSPVKIEARGTLSVASGGVLTTDGLVDVYLKAPYIAIGQAFKVPGDDSPVFKDNSGPVAVLPQHGGSVITFDADKLLDVGNLSLQAVGRAVLKANNGDVRGDGTLDVAGDVSVFAGQVYTPTGCTFTIAAYDYADAKGAAASSTVSIFPSETMLAGTSRPVPLSAGGTINIFASNIIQNGVLRAPLGAINLGLAAGDSTRDPLTGTFYIDLKNLKGSGATQSLVLGEKSITSVSAAGSLSDIPYGIMLNGANWIDPTGTDISSKSIGKSAISLVSASILDNKGSLVDISGGGDLLAYQWVTGTGGTKDILASKDSFAILPAYETEYTPYAPYNNSLTTNGSVVFGTDNGYTNGNISIGDSIYLKGIDGLKDGSYTLLPARYALLKGAYLVTKLAGAPLSANIQNDGSYAVPGFRYNQFSQALDNLNKGQPVYTMFEVASSAVITTRAQYQTDTGNAVFAQKATDYGVAVPRLPIDAGQLVFDASNTLGIHGSFAAQASRGGKGAMIDISSTQNIAIMDSQATVADTVVLSASDIGNLGAGSILIGGRRTLSDSGTSLLAQTGNITVENDAKAPLDRAAEIILAATHTLTIKDGAVIASVGTAAAPASQLSVGVAKQDGTSDGVLLRVSGDSTASVVHADGSISAAQANDPNIVIGAATLKGASFILDSTNNASLASGAKIDAANIALAGGQIGLEFDGVSSGRSGLELTNAQLQGFQTAKALSLQSYTSIDTYGSGTLGSSSLASLSLHAGTIRGSENGSVNFAAQDIFIDNAGGGTGASSSVPTASSLVLDAGGAIHLGAAAATTSETIDLSYNTADIKGAGGVMIQGQGSVKAEGDLSLEGPVVTGAAGANVAVVATGKLRLSRAGNTSVDTTGLGAQLTLTGASVAVNSDVILHSGQLTAHANGTATASGDVQVGNLAKASLDVSGTAKAFNDLLAYSGGGQVSLISDSAWVRVATGGTLDVSAARGVDNNTGTYFGNAGTLSFSAAQGDVNLLGTLHGQGSFNGQGGTFALDYKPTSDVALGALAQRLSDQGFTYSQSYRVRDKNVVVDGAATAHTFNLSADNGSVTVTGSINASGKGKTDAITKGGSIALAAQDSVILAGTASLNVSGLYYDDAGKGGSVSLASRAGESEKTDGHYTYKTSEGLRIDDGATINLKVQNQLSTSDVLAGNSVTNRTDLALGGGTLHLRAPQTPTGSDLQIINSINASSIQGADSIVVEGYKAYDLKNADGVIDTIESNARDDAGAFCSSSTQILSRHLTGNLNVHLQPGVEIVNSGGDLELKSTWDLSAWRFGDDPNNLQPGLLTLRAKDNLIFDATVDADTMTGAASLTDGFKTLTSGTNYSKSNLGQNSWLAPLATDRSWSYRLVAGADLSAADSRVVIPRLGGDSVPGSLLLGQGSLALPTDATSSRGNIIPYFYQTIRTGTGDIEIFAGNDVRLLNPLATIYTAGQQVANPTKLFNISNFDTPITAVKKIGSHIPTVLIGSQYYGAYYGENGGSVTIQAQRNIEHKIGPSLADDSTKELPNSWLYRRGSVDSTTGLFALNASDSKVVQSTSWWIDYSNFFEGVGALGGGNVSLLAATGSVVDVDAVVPTNARMPGYNNKGQIASPDASKLVELGGGSLSVRAGQDIVGGVYYVERGQGIISAGNVIRTDATRSAVSTQNSGDETTYMPTTLFLGKGSFDVSAGGDLLLGPVANPFWLPQGINNGAYNKSFFTTYAAYDSINVTSLRGNIIIRDAADDVGSATGTDRLSAGSLGAWFANVLADSFAQSQTNWSSGQQPWLKLLETFDSVGGVAVESRFDLLAAVMPPTLEATTFKGDINIVGKITTFPASTGQIDFLSAGAINGVQLNGGDPSDPAIRYYGSALVNLSDAAPSSIPSPAAPYYSYITDNDQGYIWGYPSDLTYIKAFFSETGADQTAAAGTLQDKQTRHQQGTLLHANDANPLHLYALDGDISGITLYTGKAAKIIASRDITDIAFYIQNDAASDISLVAAGRDMTLYQPNSALRLAQQALGNAGDQISALTPASGTPTAGDIQISGPGTLEVLAGRNLDLGAVPSDADGTSAGITSIGQQRNPALPFAGADVIAAVGIGKVSGLLEAASASGSTINTSFLGFQSFITEFLNPNTSTQEEYSARYLPVLASLMGRPDLSDPQQTWAEFNDDNKISPSYRAQLALDVYYRVLRDAGRDYSDPEAAGFKNYQAGRAAIAALFPAKTSASDSAWQGDLSLASREIKTTSGGAISILAPGGQLTLGYDLTTSLVPPGIITEHGGGVSIFTDKNVNVGAMRIFTLRGGDVIIWSTMGNIAAGVSSKTVKSAPPTRVLVDPQSADVTPDLAGLATGGGIGVLATVVGVPPGDVDLIAPSGTIDAGDAGIRSSGHVNVSAALIVNAANIQSSAGTTGAPVVVVPNISGLTTASTASAGASSTAGEAARQQQRAASQQQEGVLPSIIQVEVLGYGGGEGEDVSKKKDEAGNG